MAEPENEPVHPYSGPDPDNSLVSGHRDQPPPHEDGITQSSSSTQSPSTHFLEQPYDPVNIDLLKLLDSVNDEPRSSENMVSAAPCTSHAVAWSNTSSCLPRSPAIEGGSIRINEDISQDIATNLSHESSTTPSLLLNTSWDSDIQSAGSDFGRSNLNANPPKIGTRFSRESSKLLTQWFENHYNYPYPSKEETETLQERTGLSRTQIKNWLANTRRREKMHQSIQSSRKATAGFNSNEVPIDIPKRPDTPAARTKNDHQTMGPLERWVDSPPESEPATVTAIAKAVKHATSSHSK
jgi:hypothetical protein